ncbi:cysteine-rich RLK (RECEPTOR-like protein kinase) 8 [Abeliophyllum distichum]|uniref:Cysteine-rich RLK (RECEPTOR-like protein kinase) 8 n=1 Tax=Abeliophyllum distichum TaxID=126358 RepID=A0ABD1R0D4_9LAMI
MVCNRLDVADTISTLSRFIANPRPEHWDALKWLLQYLKGTFNLGLIFGTCNKGVILKGFVDADFAGDKDNRNLQLLMFLHCGTCISWKSQLQPIVALSTTDSEYFVKEGEGEENCSNSRPVGEDGRLSELSTETNEGTGLHVGEDGRPFGHYVETDDRTGRPVGLCSGFSGM